MRKVLATLLIIGFLFTHGSLAGFSTPRNQARQSQMQGKKAASARSAEKSPGKKARHPHKKRARSRKHKKTEDTSQAPQTSPEK